VVRHRLALLRRKLPDGVEHFPVTVARDAESGRPHGQFIDGNRPAVPGADDVDGFAVGDGDEPRLDVGAGRKLGVGLQGGEKSLGPAVFRVVNAENRAAHAQDRGSVLPDEQLERLLGLH